MVVIYLGIDSIRVRKGTHDNMRYPGLGVGGYCLTKDSMLAQWGASDLLGGRKGSHEGVAQNGRGDGAVVFGQ